MKGSKGLSDAPPAGFFQTEKGHYVLLFGAGVIGWLLYGRLSQAKAQP